MTVREYVDWMARYRARGRADAEFAAVMLACSGAGMAACVFVGWLLAGGW